MYGAEPLALENRGSHIGDDELRVGDERIAEQGNDRLGASPGDESKPCLRVGPKRPTEDYSPVG